MEFYKPDHEVMPVFYGFVIVQYNFLAAPRHPPGKVAINSVKDNGMPFNTNVYCDDFLRNRLTNKSQFNPKMS